ncbi:cytochrome P450 [Planosporangium thailandense]|uniref:Cytochrome P450 n=1 Tax=Planosporangium thailandense TaxID=765197 RepID=A0ABX0Y0I4_9ACTN|nr:cytochrome P450 [Planosporangium thailandense]NJC70879.1 cytochrome P450 [Planosporangium thailandense]
MSTPTVDLRLLADPALRADPYPLLRQLRAASPLSLMDGMLVVAARHRDCAALLRHPNASSERARSELVPAGLPRGALSFLSLDPPDHTRLRRLVSSAFTPRVVAGLRPRITEVVDALFARIAEQGRADIVADLAYPLPVQIISELLGVPADDHEQFRVWSARLARSLDPQFADPDQQRLDAAAQAREEFERYFGRLIAQRRAHPADDLLSLLVHAESEGDQLTEEELLATCVLLLVAGHETTANLIANAVLALLRQPDQLAALRARPALVEPCVEETLRFDPPVQLTTRIARGPLPVGDTEVPDGGIAVLLIAAANRDPEVFDDPDRFDITRGGTGHLAFAAGIHFCLGAGLARLESAVALDAFAQRVVAPRLATPTVAYKENFNLRGPARLEVEFDAVTAA